MAKQTSVDDREISEMRNLGPVCQKDLAAIGITQAHQIVELGAEQAFVKMLLGREKLGRSGKCCNATYLYALFGAIHDIDWREIPDEKKSEFKLLAAEMRASGRFR